ncbi:LysR family transcriptional regulator [Nonomuraea antimicrobica]|uniref:LysR family transcriptional regulator n=1 Tax=Nonomuraea antimicrobica TaxID=561173 RepID=A0ABP7CDY9_9ACTN
MGTQVELRQLEYFVAVADEGGFGRAAERIGIVQSAVSQQVRRLERELGVRLFDRSTRHVRLTGDGERLLTEARAVLAATRRLRRAAADVVAGDEGVLRLGVVRGPSDRLYRTLNALSAIAPRLKVRLSSLPVTERLAAVRSGELDAALVRASAGVPGLELLPVWDDPLMVALPVDHPLAAEPELDIARLAHLPLRLAPRAANPPFHDLVLDAFRAAGVEPVTGPPFRGFQETLAEIAADPPSWTVFYEVGGLPTMSRVALRPLAGLRLTTSLAVPPDPPSPMLRHLLEAVRRTCRQNVLS